MTPDRGEVVRGRGDVPGHPRVNEAAAHLDARQAGGASRWGTQALRRKAVEILRACPDLLRLAREARERGEDAVYRVEWPDGLREAVRDRVARWGPGNDGLYPAVVRDGKNRSIVGHLKLEEASQADLSVLSNLALHDAMADVGAQLEEISEQLEVIIEGQRDDRRAQVATGRDLIEQARAVTDEQQRRLLFANAVTELTRGRGQLLQHLRTRADKLEAPGLIESFLKGSIKRWSRAEKIADELQALREDLRWAALATASLAEAHRESGEPDAALTAFRQLLNAAKEPVNRLSVLAREVTSADPSGDPEAAWWGFERQLPEVARRLQALESRGEPGAQVNVTARALLEEDLHVQED